MVRNRLITVLTLNNGILFRTHNFIPDYRYTLNFVDAWSVDEVVLLDITRPGQGDRGTFFEVVSAFARECFVPLSVGGGVRSVDDFAKMLDAGADKVVVNSLAAESPNIITEAARRYGSQCVIVSMDAKRREDGSYEVYTHQGSRPSGKEPAEWAEVAESYGAGEILVQSIDRDGTLEGYDLELVRLVSGAVGIPVLACSGAGNWDHFVDGIVEAGASAACTTNIYHFTDSSICSAKQHMAGAGVLVRI